MPPIGSIRTGTGRCYSVLASTHQPERSQDTRRGLALRPVDALRPCAGHGPVGLGTGARVNASQKPGSWQVISWISISGSLSMTQPLVSKFFPRGRPARLRAQDRDAPETQRVPDAGNPESPGTRAQRDTGADARSAKALGGSLRAREASGEGFPTGEDFHHHSQFNRGCAENYQFQSVEATRQGYRA